MITNEKDPVLYVCSTCKTSRPNNAVNNCGELRPHWPIYSDGTGQSYWPCPTCSHYGVEMKKISLYEFYKMVDERVESTSERKGQAAFNLLHEIRPDLAEEIRATPIDPFYSHHNWQAFVQYIGARWY